MAEQKKGGPDLPVRLSDLLKEQATSFAEVLSGEIKARTQQA
jgi:hypothetical protein